MNSYQTSTALLNLPLRKKTNCAEHFHELQKTIEQTKTSPLKII